MPAPIVIYYQIHGANIYKYCYVLQIDELFFYLEDSIK